MKCKQFGKIIGITLHFICGLEACISMIDRACRMGTYIYRWIEMLNIKLTVPLLGKKTYVSSYRKHDSRRESKSAEFVNNPLCHWYFV